MPERNLELEMDELKKDLQEIKNLLKAIQKDMFKKAERFMQSRIVKVKNLDEMEKAVNDKCFALASWCGGRDCENLIKERMQATGRNMPFDGKLVTKTCACCGKPAVTPMYFARAY